MSATRTGTPTFGEERITFVAGVICREYVYHFPGLHGCASRCLVRVYEESGRVAVVVCDEGDDVEGKGTSVTNYAEVLYQALVAKHGRHARLFTLIEHYPLRGRYFAAERPGQPGIYQFPEQFSLVRVPIVEEYERQMARWLRREGPRPQPLSQRPKALWQYLSREQVEVITGCPWRPLVTGYSLNEWRELGRRERREAGRG